MKQPLMRCTKNVQFTYDNTVYHQNDGVVMELLFVFTGTDLVWNIYFMVELENSLVQRLNESMTLW